MRKNYLSTAKNLKSLPFQGGDPDIDPATFFRLARNSSVLLLSMAFAFVMTLWFYENYYGGDLAIYNHFYDGMKSTSFYELSNFQYSHTGSSEPFYGLVVYLISPYVDRIYFLVAVNVLFISLLAIYLLKHKVPLYIFPLLYGNYYLLILLGPAERLKLAFAVLLLAAIVRGRVWAILSLFAIPFQFSIALLPVSYGSGYLIANLKKIRGNLAFFYIFGLLSVFAIILYALYEFMGTAVSEKIAAYQSDPLAQASQMLALSAAHLYLSRRRLVEFVVLIPQLVASMLTSSSRITMLTFFYCLFVWTEEKRLSHPLSLVLLLYFDFKSISFFDNIALGGEGFGF